MTDTLRTRLVIFVVIAQMLFFAGWYTYESGAFSQPVATIRVKTAAYDPRDLLSGQYIRIRYNFSNPRGRWDREQKKMVAPQWAEGLQDQDTVTVKDRPKYREVWVTLHEVEGLYEPKYASLTQPTRLAEGEVALKGRQKRWNGIEYGIEKYFVPEGTKEPNRNDTTVELHVYKSGKVRISRVFVKGEVWP